MEGERILKALLNGETDDLFEDTKVGLRQFTTSFLAFDNFKVLYSLIYFVDNDNILTAWNNYVYVVFCMFQELPLSITITSECQKWLQVGLQSCRRICVKIHIVFNQVSEMCY